LSKGQVGVIEKFLAKPYQYISGFPYKILKISNHTPPYHLDHDNVVKG